MEEFQTLVIDNGSYFMKAGFSGDDAPRAVFPTITGRAFNPKSEGIRIGMGFKEVYFGDVALNKRGIRYLNHPIQKGLVVDWNDMERVWHHTLYNELRVAPEEHPILMSEVCWNPKESREKTTEIIFETFNSPAFHLANRSILSMYASGKTSGVVFSSGNEVSCSVPVFEGYAINDSISITNISVKEVTEYFLKLLNERGYPFTTTYEKEIVKDIKEKCCYVSLDLENELKKDPKELEKQYELPDGQMITIGDERFRAVEPFFSPFLLDIKSISFQDSIFFSVSKNDNDLSKILFSNVVLSGGGTLFPGFKKRIEKEISKKLDNSTKVKVIALPERKYLNWIGGSIFSSLSNFLKEHITKEIFEEYGPKIVNTKCPF